MAARQQVTREWFPRAARNYELFVSHVVIRKSSAGDPEAARERLAPVEGIATLAASDAAGDLAAGLVDEGAVPRTAVEDARHIAVAAVHGVDFPATWNCRHIANAAMRSEIERVCRVQGYKPPVICTPEELNNGDEV